MPLSANLFRLESSTQKHAGSSGTAPVGGEVAGGGAKPPAHKIKIEKKVLTKKNVPYKFFFSSQNVMKRMLNKSYGRLFLRGGCLGSADR